MINLQSRNQQLLHEALASTLRPVCKNNPEGRTEGITDAAFPSKEVEVVKGLHARSEGRMRMLFGVQGLYLFGQHWGQPAKFEISSFLPLH